MNLNKIMNEANKKYIALYKQNEKIVNIIPKLINLFNNAAIESVYEFKSLNNLYEQISINDEEQEVFKYFFDIDSFYDSNTKIKIISKYLGGDEYSLKIITEDKERSFLYNVIDEEINYIEIENKIMINEDLSYSIFYSHHEEKENLNPLSLKFEFTDKNKEYACKVKLHPNFEIYCTDSNYKVFSGIGSFDARIYNNKIILRLLFEKSLFESIGSKNIKLYFDFIEHLENNELNIFCEKNNINCNIVLFDFIKNNPIFYDFLKNHSIFIKI